ncbi:MAG TPA: OmpA family protein, partial [Longimicrobiales bacterium]|nr:OmpA family protein [Longimicrobiales bacterium]
ARRAFAEDTGLATTDTRAEETSHSRSGPGLVQEVAAGSHYRFLNLGQAIPDPKPEHKQAFRDIKKAHLDPQPATTLRFIGHASTPGTTAFNLDLSKRRVLAFYRLARDEGVAPDRMPEAAKPAYFGESRPTLKEEDPQTRAFNRRVELLIGAGAPGSSGAAPTVPDVKQPTEEL